MGGAGEYLEVPADTDGGAGEYREFAGDADGGAGEYLDDCGGAACGTGRLLVLASTEGSAGNMGSCSGCRNGAGAEAPPESGSTSLRKPDHEGVRSFGGYWGGP